MSQSAANNPSALYWIVSIVLLVWGLGGSSIYIAYFIEAPEDFAATAESAANAQAYGDYISNIPVWAIAVGVIAALSRLLGAIGLLARRAWALPLYIIALIFFLAAIYRAFVLANVASVMNPSHIMTEVIFVALSIFAVWFAHRSKSMGILK